ncbi:MAG: acetoin utilization protein AcuC [candidate division KSB1 bacterium]|nr:acetoin utilization protein AcuC [candidate division KSB1 bacterium]
MSSKQQNVIFVYSKQLEKHHYPPDCPFKTERAQKTRKTLNSMGLLSGPGRKEIKAEPADRRLLETFHTRRYLDTLLKCQKGDWDIEALKMGIGGPDVPVFKGMYEYGALACGCTVKAADMLFAKKAKYAFSPAGGFHHAGPELAAGFCYINDVAIACNYLAEKGQRVLYLDIDVHHGDGVQDFFYNRNDVLTLSLHESGELLFPGTGFETEIGTGPGEGYSVNMPMPAHVYNEAWLRCFDELAVPLIQAYNADVIVLELGADALSGDPLAHMQLTNNVYVEVLNYLMGLNKPLLVSGGGGYNVENTVRAWSLAWCVMNEDIQELSDMNLGLGGVMLESTDWMGGLQDRVMPVTDEQRQAVDPVIDTLIRRVKRLIFPLHGIEFSGNDGS